MTITVRIDSALERKIIAVSRRKMCTKSDIVKESLMKYFEEEAGSTPYDLGKVLFGQEGSGRNDLSTMRKTILKEKIRAKNLG